jgi:hypothetical protein
MATFFVGKQDLNRVERGYVEPWRKRNLKVPSIFVLFTDPLGVSDIGGTLAKYAKAGARDYVCT